MLKENNFIEYLNNKGYYYDTQTIENFLLSIKSNNLIIISGKSGTGKTTLINSYLDFISTNTTNKTIKSSFKLGKTVKNHGFSFIRDDVTPLYPKNKYEDECYLNVDGIKVKSRLNILSRIFFRPNENQKFIDYLNDPNKNSNDKIEFELLLDNKESDFYININSEIYNKNNNFLNDVDVIKINNIISKAKYSHNETFYIIFNNVQQFFLDIIYRIIKANDTKTLNTYFEYEEFPNNLIIICEDNSNNIKIPNDIIDYFNIITLETISPLDYLNKKNYKLDGNESYLINLITTENIKKLSFNEMIQKISNIKINEIISLNDIIFIHLDDIYYVLKNSNISLNFRLINSILKFMYVAWCYENNPEVFHNWKKYFDSLISMKILSKISSENISLECLNNLKDYFTENKFNLSYDKINEIIN